MSCNISKFDFCMLQQETFKSPIFNFGDIDVSNDSFVYTVFKSYGASKKEFPVNFIDDNTVYIEDIKMPLGDYQHELIWVRNGIKEVVFQGALKVTDKGNNCGCTSNKLDIKVIHEDVVVNITYSERIIERITDKGPQGDSAYQVAVENGFVGTEAEWLESLKLHYSDLTEAEILELQQPAIEAAQTANQAADNANTATQNAITATNEANTATVSANQSAQTANTSATNADNSAGLATSAATNANDAATAANMAAAFANSQRGWTPIHVFEADGAQRQVKKLTDYIGGTGAKPTQNINQYVIDGGYTADKSLATNFKGAQGDGLIAEYTHSGNKEVMIQSIDYTTSTFTSVGHGLINGNVIYVVPFGITGTENISTVIFGGGNMIPYYVSNSSVDTFNISASNGGANVTLTNNGTVDFSKWRFERVDVNANINYTLPDFSKLRIELKGFIGRNSWHKLSPVVDNGTFNSPIPPSRHMSVSGLVSGILAPSSSGEFYSYTSTAYFNIRYLWNLFNNLSFSADLTRITMSATTNVVTDAKFIGNCIVKNNKDAYNMVSIRLIAFNGLTIKIYNS